jgi:hypothetical protein
VENRVSVRVEGLGVFHGTAERVELLIGSLRCPVGPRPWPVFASEGNLGITLLGHHVQRPAIRLEKSPFSSAGLPSPHECFCRSGCLIRARGYETYPSPLAALRERSAGGRERGAVYSERASPGRRRLFDEQERGDCKWRAETKPVPDIGDWRRARLPAPPTSPLTRPLRGHPLPRGEREIC